MIKLAFLLYFLFLPATYAEGANFFSQAKNHISPVYQKIVNHPFNKKLLDGSLSPILFKQFTSQDSYYLAHYNEVLQSIDKVLSSWQKKYWLIDITVKDEQGYLPPLEKIKITPANYGYTNFLISTSKEPDLAIKLAAILPCQWLYFDLYGRKKVSPQHQYNEWLSLYQSKKYQNATIQLINLTNKIYQQSDKFTKSKMIDVFVQATIYEYYFWNDVYEGSYL